MSFLPEGILLTQNPATSATCTCSVLEFPPCQEVLESDGPGFSIPYRHLFSSPSPTLLICKAGSKLYPSPGQQREFGQVKGAGDQGRALSKQGCGLSFALLIPRQQEFVMLSIFAYTCWPSVCLLWENVYSDTLFLNWRDLPGGPVAKTPCSQCRGHGFAPWSVN